MKVGGDPTATDCLFLQEIHVGFGFTFLVPGHLGSSRQNPESCKMVVVVVVVVVVVEVVVRSSKSSLLVNEGSLMGTSHML